MHAYRVSSQSKRTSKLNKNSITFPNNQSSYYLFLLLHFCKVGCKNLFQICIIYGHKIFIKIHSMNHTTNSSCYPMPHQLHKRLYTRALNGHTSVSPSRCSLCSIHMYQYKMDPSKCRKFTMNT